MDRKTQGWFGVGAAALVLLAAFYAGQRSAAAAGDAPKTIYAAKIVLTAGEGDDERVLTITADGLLFTSLADDAGTPTQLSNGQLTVGGKESHVMVTGDGWRGGPGVVLYRGASPKAELVPQ